MVEDGKGGRGLEVGEVGLPEGANQGEDRLRDLKRGYCVNYREDRCMENITSILKSDQGSF